MKTSRRPFSAVEKWMLALTLLAVVGAFVWTRFQAKQLRLWKMPEESSGYSAQISPNKDIVAFTYMRSSYGASTLPSPGGWAQAYAAELRDTEGAPLSPLQAPSPNVSWLTHPIFSPDGAYVALIYSDNELQKVRKHDAVAGKHVAVWSSATGRIIWKARYADVKENASGYTVQWTPDGKNLIVDGDWVRVMDAWTGKRLRTLAQAFYIKTDCVLSPDGKRIVTINEGKSTPQSEYVGPKLTIVRDLAGRVLARLPGGGTEQAFWTRDGRMLLQILPKKIVAWSGDAKRLLWSLPIQNARSMTTSKKSDKIAWVSSRERAGCKGNPDECTETSTVHVLDLATRRILWQQKVADYVMYTRFVTDDERVFAVTREGDQNKVNSLEAGHTFTLLNAATGQIAQSTKLPGYWSASFFALDKERALLQTTRTFALWQIEPLR